MLIRDEDLVMLGFDEDVVMLGFGEASLSEGMCTVHDPNHILTTFCSYSLVAQKSIAAYAA